MGRLFRINAGRLSLFAEVRVPRRVFQGLCRSGPPPERCVEAYNLRRTWFASIAERKLRRRER
jgi:hypothetical protein